jgi:hypothetical protein
LMWAAIKQQGGCMKPETKALLDRASYLEEQARQLEMEQDSMFPNFPKQARRRAENLLKLAADQEIGKPEDE